MKVCTGPSQCFSWCVLQGHWWHSQSLRSRVGQRSISSSCTNRNTVGVSEGEVRSAAFDGEWGCLRPGQHAVRSRDAAASFSKYCQGAAFDCPERHRQPAVRIKHTCGKKVLDFLWIKGPCYWSYQRLCCNSFISLRASTPYTLEGRPDYWKY